MVSLARPEKPGQRASKVKGRGTLQPQGRREMSPGVAVHLGGITRNRMNIW